MDSDQSPDVYRDWLGIQDTERPLDYYQLLRLKKFEDDQDRIQRHYRKMHKHARKFATGEFTEESQNLLNELARAMLCLTDLSRKTEYDESCGRRKTAGRAKRKLQDILIKKGLLSTEQLKIAQQYSEAVGLPLRDAICQKGFVPHVDVTRAYAQSEGLSFLDLNDVEIDKDLLPKISVVTARTHSIVPVMIENQQLLLASPNRIDLQLEENIRLGLGMQVRMVLCTSNDIHRVITEHYSREQAEAELVQKSDATSEAVEPQGLAKTWDKLKKWVEKHNKK
ncbi:MAG: hypothetical protein P8K78_09815 [Pirellulales bacterium]|nr:hypothetical protein [Pirellulales bacterium]